MTNSTAETAYTQNGERIKVTPLASSELIKKDQTRVVINPRFRDQLTINTLSEYLFLPDVDSQESVPFSEPDSPYRRNREVANTEKLFVLTEPSGYRRVGIISIKAAGMKVFDPEKVAYLEWPADSLGVVEPDEAMIDMNVSDYLDAIPGSDIGSNLGFISIARGDFLASLRNRGFIQYEEYLKSNGFLKKTETNTPVVFIIRFTDSERFPYISRHYKSDEHLQKNFNEFLFRSIELFKQEFKLNGKVDFLNRYIISDEILIQHLENDQINNQEKARRHLLLLIHIITINVLAVRSLNLYHEVGLKDIGNMGKLMDFAPSLDHFNLKDDQKKYKVDHSLEQILEAFSSLDIFDNGASEKVVAKAKASFASVNQK